jgi:hypothetical protein
VTEELRAQMEALRDLAPRLNKTSDSASTLIKTVEKFLNDLGIGISAYGRRFHQEQGSTDDGDVITVSSFLRYGRLVSGFCIHVSGQVTDASGNFMSEDYAAWPSCGREFKLKAIPTLPSLLENLLANAKEQVEAADATAETLRSMMESLGTPASTVVADIATMSDYERSRYHDKLVSEAGLVPAAPLTKRKSSVKS